MDIVGKTFGKLTVERFSRMHEFECGGKHAVFRAGCSCGRKIEARRQELLSGRLTACSKCRVRKRYTRVDELLGKRFGRLVVGKVLRSDKEPTPSRPHRVAPVLEVTCDCGVVTEAKARNLRDGVTKSCGCLAVEHVRGSATHGYTVGYSSSGKRRPEYTCWLHVKKYYGSDFVCKAWMASFETFIADMGDRPSSKHVLHRISRKKRLSPSNCCWKVR